MAKRSTPLNLPAHLYPVRVPAPVHDAARGDNIYWKVIFDVNQLDRERLIKLRELIPVLRDPPLNLFIEIVFTNILLNEIGRVIDPVFLKSPEEMTPGSVLELISKDYHIPPDNGAPRYLEVEQTALHDTYIAMAKQVMSNLQKHARGIATQDGIEALDHWISHQLASLKNRLPDFIDSLQRLSRMVERNDTVLKRLNGADFPFSRSDYAEIETWFKHSWTLPFVQDAHPDTFSERAAQSLLDVIAWCDANPHATLRWEAMEQELTQAFDITPGNPKKVFRKISRLDASDIQELLNDVNTTDSTDKKQESARYALQERLHSFTKNRDLLALLIHVSPSFRQLLGDTMTHIHAHIPGATTPDTALSLKGLEQTLASKYAQVTANVDEAITAIHGLIAAEWEQLSHDEQMQQLEPFYADASLFRFLREFSPEFGEFHRDLGEKTIALYVSTLAKRREKTREVLENPKHYGLVLITNDKGAQEMAVEAAISHQVPLFMPDSHRFFELIDHLHAHGVDGLQLHPEINSEYRQFMESLMVQHWEGTIEVTPKQTLKIYQQLMDELLALIGYEAEHQARAGGAYHG